MRWLLVIASLLLSWISLRTASLYGQNQPHAASTQPTIATDRPAVTDSSIVVPSGDLLFENGFTETGNQGQRSFDFPETLARFGLTGTTELRFSGPDYFQNFNTGHGFGSGWGDLGLGVKQQLSTFISALAFRRQSRITSLDSAIRSNSRPFIVKSGRFRIDDDTAGITQ